MDIDPNTDQPEVLPQEGEPEVPAPEEEPEQQATEDQPQSKSQNAKQRLRRKLRQEQQARFEAEERSKQLEEKFATLEQKLDPVINPPPPRPSRDDYESEESYEDALLDWRDASRSSSPVSGPSARPAQPPPPAARPDAADPVSPEVRKNWESQMDNASDKYEDFDDALVSIPRESMSDHMTFAIMESDQGGEVAYFLGKNHTEAARIADMTPTQQIREIDKLAKKFAPTTSSAPPPITPTKGGDSPQKKLEDMSPEEYRAFRRHQGMPW